MITRMDGGRNWTGEPFVRHDGVKAGLLDFAYVIRAAFLDAPDRSVLDVGGGDGWLGDFLACREYTCIDSRASDDVAVMDAHALTFKAKEFDLVVSKQTLVHFHDPVTAVREMMRVAKVGVVIRQEFPDGGPIGWPGHSWCRIESPNDISTIFAAPEWSSTYNGTDFIARRTA